MIAKCTGKSHAIDLCVKEPEISFTSIYYSHSHVTLHYSRGLRWHRRTLERDAIIYYCCIDIMWEKISLISCGAVGTAKQIQTTTTQKRQRGEKLSCKANGEEHDRRA